MTGNAFSLSFQFGFKNEMTEIYLCKLNKATEPMNMNHLVRAFFSSNILAIYILGCCKHGFLFLLQS